MLRIPNVFKNLVSGNAGASDLQPTKQTMCEHMVDGGDCKNTDAGDASNQILNHVRYIAIASTLIILAAAGCSQNTHYDNGTCLYHGQTHAKPIVSIVPVIDSTKSQLDWNLSDELSSAIYQQLAESGKFSLTNPSQVRSATKQLHDAQNPFGTDISWVKQTFSGNEFVVFLELTEHEEVLRQDRKRIAPPEQCSADLNMSMRIRVIDIRGDDPKVVLQELLHDSHFIPRPFTYVNFYQTPWGNESFTISPLGLAHTQFTKEIATRLQEYTLLSLDLLHN